MKYLFISFLAMTLFVGGVAIAQNDTNVDEVEQAESVTLADLEVEDTGILPTSPFYFFKEWGRGVQSFFTFNAVGKVELEAKFANEKAAELKKVEEEDSDNETGIARALLNFQRAQEKVALRLDRLKETSENPNVDRLIEKIVEKSILHEKLLQEVVARHEDKEEVRLRVKSAGLSISDVIKKAAEKDNPEKFVARLKDKLEATRGSELKDIRAVEILDRIGENVSEEVRVRLEIVRDGFKEKARLRIEALAEEGEDRVRTILDHIPGDSGRRAVVLEEIRLKVSDRASGALKRAQDAVEEKISDSPDRKEKTAEQIRRAATMIEKAQEKVSGVDELREAAKNLLEQAERHLASAKVAFEEEKYGEAFGQARAAEVAARNALHALERGEISPSVIDLREIQDKLRDRTRILERIAPVSQPNGETRPRTQDDILCTQEFKPVCGVDGETYSNRCNAEKQNRVRVAYEGECRDDQDTGILRDSIAPSDILRKILPERILPDFIQDKTNTVGDQNQTSTTSSSGQDLSTLATIPPVSRVVEADDSGFYPSSEISVPKGAKVTLEFKVRSTGVYFAGLDFRSDKFKTKSIAPGSSVKVEFVADESFKFTSWWPASDRLKATGRVVVE